MVSMIQYDTTVQQITFTIKHLGIKNTQILILRSSYKTKSNTYKMHLCPFFLTLFIQGRMRIFSNLQIKGVEVF